MSNLCDGVGGKHLYGGNASSWSFVSDRFGNPNSAIYFNNSYLQAPSGTYFSGDFTITAWVYFYSFTDFPSLFDFSNGLWADNVLLGIQDSCIRFLVTVGDWTPLFSSSEISLSTWYHVAVGMKGSKGFLYINGNLSSIGTLPIPQNVYRVSNFIGWDNFGDSYLNAILDEIKIYEIALSADEINQDMSIGGNNSKQIL